MANPANNETRIPKGYVPIEVRRDTLNVEDRTVEVIFSTGAAVKRYSWSEGYYMEELSMDPKSVRLKRFNDGAAFLDTHDSWTMASRLGAIVPGTARIEGGKGLATVKLSRKAEAEQILQDLKDGIPLSLSVGYRVHEYERTEGNDKALPKMRATDWEPMELSAVPIPADPGAHARSEPTDVETFDVRITTRIEPPAAQDAPQLTETKDMTTENNNAGGTQQEQRQEPVVTEKPAGTAQPATTTTEQRQTAVDPAAPTADQIREAERVRVQTINDLGARHSMDAKTIKAAVDGNVTVEAFRGQILDAIEKRTTTDTRIEPRVDQTPGAQDEVTTRREAMTNALLNRADPSRTKLTDAGRQYRGLSLIEMVRENLRENNVNVRGLTYDELAKRAFMSTSDFPIILEGVTNRTLLAAYEAYPQTFKPFCKQATARDFKDMHRVQLGAAGSLLLVNESGEYKRSSLGEGKEKYRIATYGRIVAVTRQTLINDDLGAFTDLPNAFGQAVSNIESDLVWGIITGNTAMSSDNKALFHADHKNLVAAPAAFSADSIAAARLLMGKQKDTDGKTTLNLRPAFMLLPQTLEYKAEQLLGSFVPTQAGNVTPESMRKLTPVVEPRLDDSSTTAHYLVASPAQRAAIEFAYLEGNEGPYTESRVGFDVDGVEFKVRLDFGAAPLDWRPIVKQPGA